MRERNIGWRLDYVLASEALAGARDGVSGAEGRRHQRPRAGDGDVHLAADHHEATKSTKDTNNVLYQMSS